MQTTQTIHGKQTMMMQQRIAIEPAAWTCSCHVIVPLVLFVASAARSLVGVLEFELLVLLLLVELLLVALVLLAIVWFKLVRLAWTVELRAFSRALISVMLTLVEFDPELCRLLRSVLRPLILCLAKAMSVSVFVEMRTAIETKSATVTLVRNLAMLVEIK